MTIEKVFNNFESSTNWNAIFYILQKILSAIFTIVLFKKLTVNEFATWANINSIVFLTLLWMDFGFRKSVPKFIPEFSKNKTNHILFTKFIFKCQLVALLIALTFLIFQLNNISQFLGISMSKQIIYLTVAFFMLEAPISFLRLIYYSHFWNKHFNILYSIITLFETMICLLLILTATKFNLINILIIKIIAAALNVIFALVGLINLYKTKEYLNEYETYHEMTQKNFLKHSSLMWCNNTLKSLSERNFLVPMITFVLGPELANIFKISNDWALVFQRTIIKTIGTNDTSLFAYINALNKSRMQEALNKVINKILLICIPLVFLFIILLFNKNYFLGENQIIFRSFFTLSIFYIIESILSPFERLLEVNKEYLILFLSYLPFASFIYLFYSNQYFSSYGLELFIILLCIIRLISSLIFVYFAKKKYQLQTKLKDVINVRIIAVK